MKKNIIIIGAGNRIQNSILPALKILGSCFNITGIVTKTEKNHELIGQLSSIKTSTNIKTFDLSNIDWIIIAIDLDEVPNVLKDLLSYGLNNCELFLDTPVLMSSDRNSIKYIRQYKAVHTTEESFLLPQYLIARNIINNRLIGTLKRIWMIHSGFKYHAIAAIKGIAMQKHVLRASFMKYGKNNLEMNLVFRNGVKATIIEPRDYEAGRMFIAGSEGLITDYKLKTDSYNCPIYRIGYKTEKQRIICFTLNEKICEESELDRLFFEKLDVSIIPNPTIMNQLKIRALMEYFESKMYGREGFSYDFTQGIYDADLIKISSKLKWWYDFPVHLGFSSLSLISRLHLI